MASPQTLQHIGIIMDGNGRWAKKRGMPRLYGHRKGIEALKKVSEAAIQQEVPFLTVWAFSTENWHRPADEVEGILKLLEEYLQKDIQELHENGIKLKTIGDLSKFSPKLRNLIINCIDRTKHNTKLTLTIALNYGGRQELILATQKIAQLVANGELSPNTIQESTIQQYLFAPDLPEPDLIIRTSGEMRLSGFLLWESIYSEYVFTDTLWPDFKAQDLESAIKEYYQRDRRYGKISTKIA